MEWIQGRCKQESFSCLYFPHFMLGPRPHRWCGVHTVDCKGRWRKSSFQHYLNVSSKIMIYYSWYKCLMLQMWNVAMRLQKVHIWVEDNTEVIFMRYSRYVFHLRSALFLVQYWVSRSTQAPGCFLNSIGSLMVNKMFGEIFPSNVVTTLWSMWSLTQILDSRKADLEMAFLSSS